MGVDCLCPFKNKSKEIGNFNIIIKRNNNLKRGISSLQKHQNKILSNQKFENRSNDRSFEKDRNLNYNYYNNDNYANILKRNLNEEKKSLCNNKLKKEYIFNNNNNNNINYKNVVGLYEQNNYFLKSNINKSKNNDSNIKSNKLGNLPNINQKSSIPTILMPLNNYTEKRDSNLKDESNYKNDEKLNDSKTSINKSRDLNGQNNILSNNKNISNINSKKSSQKNHNRINNFIRQSKGSNNNNNGKRRPSCDSKISTNDKEKINNEYNNIEKDKKKRNKHVSFDKYKQQENFCKSGQKIEIDCSNTTPIVNPNSDAPKGLYNLGLSCYMNSLLQCLFYIQELRIFFISKKDEFREDQPVCKALSEVMYGLKYCYKEYFEPKQFKKVMGNKNSLFSGVKAGDAKDLFFNLIDSLLNETLKENDNQSSAMSINLANKENVFREIQKEVDEKNIINDLFIGYYEIIYKCERNNKTNIYSFSTETFILFNLEKISNYYQNNKLTIDDCFEYNYKRRYETSFYCTNCKKTENNITEDIIYRPPKILVIILDRGKGKSFKGKVIFEEKLDLKDFIDEQNYEYSSKYKLISVSTHSGTSSSSGHYTACCLTDNGDYYYFSDTYVHKVDKNKIYENEPYLLFYRRNS